MLVFGIHCPFFLASPIQMEFSDVMIFSFLAKCTRPKNQAHLRDLKVPERLISFPGLMTRVIKIIFDHAHPRKI